MLIRKIKRPSFFYTAAGLVAGSVLGAVVAKNPEQQIAAAVIGSILGGISGSIKDQSGQGVLEPNELIEAAQNIAGTS